jgi:hypothetical protein
MGHAESLRVMRCSDGAGAQRGAGRAAWLPWRVPHAAVVAAATP